MLNGRSISSEVEAANGKLAALLRAQEEDAQLLQIGKRKVLDQAKAETAARPRGKAARWSIAADFNTPVALPGRPRTADGATTFSAGFDIIAKQGVPRLRGRPLGGFDDTKDPGVAHARYVHRDGAPERILCAEHEGYVSRSGAVERLPEREAEKTGLEHGDALLTALRERLFRERDPLLDRDQPPGTEAVFSNISDYQDEREDYWHAVYRCERIPRTHSLIVDPAHAPGWWAEVETWPGIPDAFRTHCLAEWDRYAEWLRQKEQGRKVAAFRPAPFEGDEERCGVALAAAKRVPGFEAKRPPVWFKSGRGGRIQYRWVLELPHELTPEDRAAIVLEFCHHLATIAKDEQGRTVGMMYTAAIHKPDAHGDCRNFHVHLDAHDRPARWIDDLGQWDFEVVETFMHRGENRERYPHRQNKVPEVTRNLPADKRHAHFNPAIAGKNFLPHLRKVWADITNQVLERRGIDRRIDPRSNAMLGIDRIPAIHLGSKASALERSGVPTIVGRHNQAAYWAYRESQLEATIAAALKSLHDEQDEADRLAATGRSNGLIDASCRFLRLTTERSRLIADAISGRRAVLRQAMLEEKAKSRALLTIRVAETQLERLKRGLAGHNVRPLIEQRLREARAHVATVDGILAPYRAALEQTEHAVQKMLDRIAAIDTAMIVAREAVADFLHPPTPTLARIDADEIPSVDSVTRTDRLPLSDQHDPATSAQCPEIALPTKAAGSRSLAIAPPTPQCVDPKPDPSKAGEASGRQQPVLAATLPLVERGAVTVRHSPNVNDEPVSPRRASGQPQSGQFMPAPTTSAPQPEQAHTPADPVAARRPRSSRGPIDDGPILPASRLPTASSLSRVSSLPRASALPRASMLPKGQDTGADIPRAVVTQDHANPAPLQRQPADWDASTESVRVPFGFSEGLGPVPTTTMSNNEGSIVVEEGSSSGSHAGRRIPYRGKLDADIAAREMERASWDRLLDRVAAERITVVMSPEARGKVFEVPSLSLDERRLLESPRLRARSQKRLRPIHDTQQLEVGRLVNWIEDQGWDRHAIIFEGRTAHLRSAPKAIVTLWGHHKRQNAVRYALRNASNRQRATLTRDHAAVPRDTNTAPDKAGPGDVVNQDIRSGGTRSRTEGVQDQRGRTATDGRNHARATGSYVRAKPKHFGSSTAETQGDRASTESSLERDDLARHREYLVQQAAQGR